MKDLTLSLVQFGPVLGNTTDNCQRMIEFIESSSGSDIICFPEASLTGYTSKAPERFSIGSSDNNIVRIRDAAKEFNKTVVFGFLEQCGDKLYITQAIIDDHGGMNLYRKTHLGRDERLSFEPGSEIVPFKTSKATIGMQLCWESHFPEITGKLRKNGAEVILMSYASPHGGSRRRDLWMRHVPARAADNCVFVGVVNTVGNNGEGTVFGGGTIVFDPKGRIIGEYFGDDEHALTVKLSSADKNILGSDDDMGNIDYFRYRRDDIY